MGRKKYLKKKKVQTGAPRRGLSRLHWGIGGVKKRIK